jgi:hypothetical protein
MKVHVLTSPPAPALTQALAEFEAQFRYPLGGEAWFSIEHPGGYWPFFAAIGPACLFVAEDSAGVAGTLAGILRSLRFPDGAERMVAYLCDLKVRPSARGGSLLPRLFGAVEETLRPRCGGLAYGVVMHGSRRLPPDYTGRLGIPGFVEAGPVTLFRVETASAGDADGIRGGTPEEFAACYSGLCPAGYVTLGGNPSLRSAREPQCLLEQSGAACGILEDTRRGKRLMLGNGEELLAAHLSRFAYSDPHAAVRLIHAVAARCASDGVPSLFVSLPARAAAELEPCLAGLRIHPARATIYGCGLAVDHADWWITSAEI